jgi:hypothetical protein
MPSNRAFKELVLTSKEIKWDSDIIQWSWTHESCMYFGSLVTVLRLSKFIYEIGTFGIASRPKGETARILVDQIPPATNTQGATPRKDKGKV